MAILRALLPGRRLGVIWWLFPDEEHNQDGSHREYLRDPDTWRTFDPGLFDALARINVARIRDVEALEDCTLLPGAFFVRDQIPCDVRPYSRRLDARQEWLAHAAAALNSCDLVFLDPDNGISTGPLTVTRRAAGKNVMIDELQTLLRPDRALIVYHHHTRHKGGHKLELQALTNRLLTAGLPVAGALRAKPRSPRAFIIINADSVIRTRAKQIADAWKPRIAWHPV